MLTSSFPITIDGVRLDTLAFNISTISGRRGLPGVRTADVQLPGVHGLIPSFEDTFEAAEVILSMWVAGCDENGFVPTSSRDLYDKNLDMLLHLFGAKNRLLDVRMTMGDNTIRQAWGRVVAAVVPDVVGSNPVGKFAVAVQVPEVFWHDVDPTIFTEVASIVSPRTMVLTTLEGSTAPIEDAVFVVKGPAVNPRLSSAETGGWVQLNRSLTALESWRVNSGKWFSEVGVVAMGFDGSAVTNEISKTTYSGSGARLLTVIPARLRPDIIPSNTVRTVELILGGTGFSAATSVLVQARKKFL